MGNGPLRQESFRPAIGNATGPSRRWRYCRNKRQRLLNAARPVRHISDFQSGRHQRTLERTDYERAVEVIGIGIRKQFVQEACDVPTRRQGCIICVPDGT